MTLIKKEKACKELGDRATNHINDGIKQMKTEQTRALLIAIVSVTLLNFSLQAQQYNVPERPTDISPLLIGEAIPTVALPDAGGKTVNLNARIAEKPTILIFYRGGWCPFCNKELAAIQDIQPRLIKMGYQIIAISTDSPENLRKSIGKHQLTYSLLSDGDLRISMEFGIAFRAPAAYDNTLAEGSGGRNVGKLLPVPSVFIVDQHGIIQFEYINPDFKQRISPDLLQSVATVVLKKNTAGK